MNAGTDTMIGAMDKILEHRARLAICVLLSRNDKMNFSRFKELLGETDGNLGAQLRKLEDAGYVTARKTFQGRKPVSWYKLSGAGKKALKAHISAMSTLLESAFNE
jgi:DNA-binding PadR family transcriptional regulator